ncbi:PREDICTED: phosphatidylglycerol/phosphatidylinositol transfer protein-like [Amphimedon queenslandica]|uniref:MD-2-related lipid-recognition domain-containing protein n=2 Tax=Amphimedon queenslandica TaxID=400682 RepID=A0AAN0JQJ2_AMPQE|nr:PREDICTED: phosphatidylglycerol/phosphatidylinositol transfer protein-like [Amphimedon queenslandica]|eukprot:XP_019859312.1 PREDICTED: phosphatidylglycerol/phosphatidylinositol transfer protein-like [Amphimedon queenslandica]
MGRLVEYILLLLSVVLVVSTLTGSTNNYYNGPTGNKGFTDCPVTTKFGKLTNESLTPNPLTRGEEFYWQAQVHIKETLTWGELHFLLAHAFKNYINITFIDVKLNLCDFFYDLAKKHCPIQPGIYHIHYIAKIPKLLWTGQYHVKATAHNEKDDELFCEIKEIFVN